MFKFYIGTNEVQEQPKGWEGISTDVRIDREMKGVFMVMDTSLTFYSDGYELIKAERDANGHCGSVEFQILQREDNGLTFYPIFTGIVFIKDCEFSEGIEGNSVRIKATDNSLFAKIMSNKSVKMKITSGLSKNSETIDTPTQYTLRFFQSDGTYLTPVTGVGSERNNAAFKVYDVLNALVQFMSDGEMDFYSDTFGSGGDYEEFMITCGYIVRFADTAGITEELFNERFPDISFSEAFGELDKQFNLGFVIGTNGSRAYIRIERWEYLYPQNRLATFDDVDIIKTKVASEYLYSRVRVGSSNTVDDSALAFPETIRFVGFKEEEYYITGECNIDRELNLVNEWILSSNIIEDLVENGQTTAPTDYDSTVILVNYEFTGGNYNAVQSNWINNLGTDYFYNELLNTNNKMTRYLGAIPNNIALNLAPTNNTCQAQLSANMPGQVPYSDGLGIHLTLLYAPLPFNNDSTGDNNDPGNNWDTTTYRYTAPLGGQYSFYAHIYYTTIALTGSGGAFPFFQIRIYHYNAANTLLGTYSSPNFTPVSSGSSIEGISQAINMTAGDYVTYGVYFQSAFPDLFQFEIQSISYMRCIATSDGGGIYASYDPDEYPINKASFTVPYSFESFRTMQNDPRGLILASVKRGSVYSGWIENLKFLHAEGIAKVEMIYKKSLNR
jgi:hypothetical protein